MDIIWFAPNTFQFHSFNVLNIFQQYIAHNIPIEISHA